MCLDLYVCCVRASACVCVQSCVCVHTQSRTLTQVYDNTHTHFITHSLVCNHALKQAHCTHARTYTRVRNKYIVNSLTLIAILIKWQTRHNFVGEIRIFSVKTRINPYPSFMHRCIAKTFTRSITRCSLEKNLDSQQQRPKIGASFHVARQWD